MAVDLSGENAANPRLPGITERVARSPAGLLITGETGTGKGRLARCVHEMGPRRDRPFVHVDCAALSPTVIESELFGHERGAFTDAVARRRGRLELAQDGTLFLDEIGDLDPSLQSKLLRVLQDREFERVGGADTLRFRARVIAATHRNLPDRIATGCFRSDLYYRLDVLSIVLPPLRERLAELPQLVAELSAEVGQERLRFSAESMARLEAHAWPGNVRELANVLERCVIFAPSGRVDRAAVERALARTPVAAPLPAPEVQHAHERQAIVAELLATGGNVRRAARRLGMARSTLRYRLQRLGLEHLTKQD